MLAQAGGQGGADGEPGPEPHDFNCCLHRTFTDGDTNINTLNEGSSIKRSGQFHKMSMIKVKCVFICLSVSQFLGKNLNVFMYFHIHPERSVELQNIKR